MVGFFVVGDLSPRVQIVKVWNGQEINKKKKNLECAEKIFVKALVYMTCMNKFISASC